MKKKDLMYLLMCEDIISKLEEKSSYWKCYGVLTNQINQVKRLTETISLDISDKAKEHVYTFVRENNGLVLDLAQKVSKIALKAKAYAKINDLPELIKLFDISKDELMNDNEEQFVCTCESILNHTGSFQNHLIEDFNLSEELILCASANLMQVKQMLNLREKLQQTDLLLTENMRKKINTLKLAIDVLDDLIYGIIEDEDFIRMYRSVRKRIFVKQ